MSTPVEDFNFYQDLSALEDLLKTDLSLDDYIQIKKQFKDGCELDNTLKIKVAEFFLKR